MFHFLLALSRSVSFIFNATFALYRSYLSSPTTTPTDSILYFPYRICSRRITLESLSSVFFNHHDLIILDMRRVAVNKKQNLQSLSKLVPMKSDFVSCPTPLFSCLKLLNYVIRYFFFNMSGGATVPNEIISIGTVAIPDILRKG